MESAFLNKIGLGNLDIGYLFLILFILLIVLIIGVGYIIYENIKFRIAYKRAPQPTAWKKRFSRCARNRIHLESLASSIPGK